MITVTVEATVPDEKMLFAFLDWVKTFDKTWPGCQFRLFSEGGEQSVGEVVQMLERLGLTIHYVERKP